MPIPIPASTPHSKAPDAPHDASFRTQDFDFELPAQLIAQHPAPERSASRLLDGRAAQPAHRIFHELPQLLQEGDLLVFNDTKVLQARLYGEKASGGKLQMLIERVTDQREVVVHLKASKKPRVGDVVRLYSDADTLITARLLGRWPDAHGALFRFELSHDPYWVMERFGHVPLPPYIEHDADAHDAQRYQSVLAKHPGAVAAPTASLHFDDALLTRLHARGIAQACVTLHVGAGTFAPVKVDNIAEHSMHFERYHIPDSTLQAIAACKARGARVIAVGTTTVRTLESYAKTQQASAETNIFITPGFDFQVVDLLITNFHLPKSTLMMLVSAFAGYAHIKALYQCAVAQRYRFFSYGDAMLLQRAT